MTKTPTMAEAWDAAIDARPLPDGARFVEERWGRYRFPDGSWSIELFRVLSADAMVGENMIIDEASEEVFVPRDFLITTRNGLPPGLQWQPIETAPKDGTDVILFVPAWSRPVTLGYFTDLQRVEHGKVVHETKHWSIRGMFLVGDDAPKPTHWMPFPEPPGPAAS